MVIYLGPFGIATEVFLGSKDVSPSGIDLCHLSAMKISASHCHQLGSTAWDNWEPESFKVALYRGYQQWCREYWGSPNTETDETGHN